ncbi:MAG: sugar-binding domain-containing protein [Eubacteriales bacterium]|nr:sugar-binding domain-containing protein [Eubacteriales bacterium]
MHESTFRLLEQLAPGQLNEICLRAMVLERVGALEPVGRRALAQRLKMREREVRAVCESLREDGLLEMSAAGMCITEKARPLLEEARSISRTRLGTATLETQLEHLLDVSRVRIAPEGEIAQVGRIAAQHIRSILRQGTILAVSGGETMRSVAEAITPGAHTDVLVLPARGGFGERVEVQADALAEEFANRLGGRHRLLHMPDGLPADMLREFVKIESVSQTLDDLRHTDILLYGVAGVEKIAAERQMHPQREMELTGAGAKAFVLGSWYDGHGRQIEGYDEGLLGGWDFKSIPHVVAVACGAAKAAAVVAVARHHAHELLVVDEACARAMLEILRADQSE